MFHWSRARFALTWCGKELINLYLGATQPGHLLPGVAREVVNRSPHQYSAELPGCSFRFGSQPHSGDPPEHLEVMVMHADQRICSALLGYQGLEHQLHPFLSLFTSVISPGKLSPFLRNVLSDFPEGRKRGIHHLRRIGEPEGAWEKTKSKGLTFQEE